MLFELYIINFSMFVLFSFMFCNIKLYKLEKKVEKLIIEFLRNEKKNSNLNLKEIK